MSFQASQQSHLERTIVTSSSWLPHERRPRLHNHPPTKLQKTWTSHDNFLQEITQNFSPETPYPPQNPRCLSSPPHKIHSHSIQWDAFKHLRISLALLSFAETLNCLGLFYLSQIKSQEYQKISSCISSLQTGATSHSTTFNNNT